MLELLKDLEKNDNKYWRQVLSAAGRLLEPENTYNYQVRAKQHNFFQNNCVSALSKLELKKTIEYIKRKKK